jgi:hypothetical protein
MSKQNIKINNALQLYRFLIQASKDKNSFPSKTSRNFINKEIKESFQKYKNEKNENIIKIQLERVNFN